MIWDHPRAGNHATESKLRVRPSQNYPKLRKWHNREESRKFHNSSHFRPWKYIFAVLTQQSMWRRLCEKLEWLVELIWASSSRVIRWQERASSKISKKARKCSHQLFESFLAWFSLIFWNSVQSFSLSSVSKITVRCQDSSYLNGSSRLRLGKEPVKIYSQVLIIFVTSCYVLNKVVILSELSISEWSGAIPGQEITPRSRNWESDRPKTIQNLENDRLEKKEPNTS